MNIRDINTIFTEKVEAYLSAGYRINTGTMSGTQGEVAKVDLTNGKIIVRVRMESHYSIVGDTLTIFVGMTDRVPTDTNDRSIVWNGDLLEISTDTFWAIGEMTDGWFGTKEESQAARKKHRMRQYARYTPGYKFFDTDEAKRAVLPYLHRTKGCKSAKLKDIDRVYRNMVTGTYWVDCRGHAYCLN